MSGERLGKLTANAPFLKTYSCKMRLKISKGSDGRLGNLELTQVSMKINLRVAVM